MRGWLVLGGVLLVLAVGAVASERRYQSCLTEARTEGRVAAERALPARQRQAEQYGGDAADVRDDSPRRIARRAARCSRWP